MNSFASHTQISFKARSFPQFIEPRGHLAWSYRSNLPTRTFEYFSTAPSSTKFSKDELCKNLKTRVITDHHQINRNGKSMAKIQLLGTEASFPCARIVWALKVKGIPFEFVEEDLLNKSPLLLKMNPVYKKVPVLIHDGEAVAESLIILEYIDETWKVNPLLPEDPYARAMARFWARYNDEKVVISSWQAMMSNGDEKAIESAQEALQLLEKQIQGKKFFGGEEIGYLDIVVGWVSLWLGAMEQVGGIKLLDPIKFPSLTEWTHNFAQVPVIHESLPPNQNVVNYFQFGLDYMRSMAANK